MDHWEGLKDMEWFWRRDNGLEVQVYGTAEALQAIHAGFEPPHYVPLELLAMGTLARLRFKEVSVQTRSQVAGCRLETFALNHYSGSGSARRYLDTLGYRVTTPEGVVVTYVSDHEPTPETLSLERRMLSGCHLALYDAHFSDVASQTHGHGSQEHAAAMSREHPGTLVLAGHHGPSLADGTVRAAYRRYGRGLRNYKLAVEGASYAWDGTRFTRR